MNTNIPKSLTSQKTAVAACSSSGLMSVDCSPQHAVIILSTMIQNLKLIKEYEYELKYSDYEKQSSVLGVITDDTQVHMIDFLYNRNEKAYICSSLTANIKDFNFTKKELFRVKSDEIKQFTFAVTGAAFDSDSGASMIVNEDKNAFAVTVDIKDRLAETHKLFLYDNKLNKKIDHTFKREIKDRKFRYENIDVSKDGNTLYLLGKVYTDEKKSKKTAGNTSLN